MEGEESMTLDRVFIAMYRALSVLYDERPDEEEMLWWLGDANPYIWADHRAVDGEVQSEFEDFAEERGCTGELSSAESYEMVGRFLRMRFAWGERFDDISEGEWASLCKLVDEEESSRLVSHVDWAGVKGPFMGPFSDLKGKTLKSIEYVPIEGLPTAYGAVRLNMGRYALLLDLRRETLLGRQVTDFMYDRRDLREPFAPPGGGVPRAYLVGEVVTGVEYVRYAASIDGAPLESRPEDGYDFEWMPGQGMALVITTKHGVRALYRRGAAGELIHVADHVPDDDELGMGEWAAFWAEGGHDVEVRREAVAL